MQGRTDVTSASQQLVCPQAAAGAAQHTMSTSTKSKPRGEIAELTASLQSLCTAGKRSDKELRMQKREVFRKVINYLSVGALWGPGRTAPAAEHSGANPGRRMQAAAGMVSPIQHCNSCSTRNRAHGSAPSEQAHLEGRA